MERVRIPLSPPVKCLEWALFIFIENKELTNFKKVSSLFIYCKINIKIIPTQ